MFIYGFVLDPGSLDAWTSGSRVRCVCLGSSQPQVAPSDGSTLKPAIFLSEVCLPVSCRRPPLLSHVALKILRRVEDVRFHRSVRSHRIVSTTSDLDRILLLR